MTPREREEETERRRLEAIGVEAGRLSLDQSADANRRSFVARLMLAGWKQDEAEQEYRNIQNESEGEL